MSETADTATRVNRRRWLYVADASIMPTALGNNPLLTIAALSECIADHIVRDPRHASLFQPPPRRPEPATQST